MPVRDASPRPVRGPTLPVGNSFVQLLPRSSCRFVLTREAYPTPSGEILISQCYESPLWPDASDGPPRPALRAAVEGVGAFIVGGWSAAISRGCFNPPARNQ